MNFLLDTNVISELVKHTPYKPLVKWISDINSKKLYLSVISIGEIRKGIKGIQDPEKQEKISHWLETELPNYFENRILNIDIKVADRWGQLQSKDKGYTLPAVDGLIAATASVYNLKLVTRNKKDFIRTPIEIINPWEESDSDL